MRLHTNKGFPIFGSETLCLYTYGQSYIICKEVPPALANHYK